MPYLIGPNSAAMIPNRNRTPNRISTECSQNPTTAMNTAAAREIRASEPPILNRMRKTSEFFRKLSLKAEKNWHQNRGAKRRVIRRDEDMGLPSEPASRAGGEDLYKR